MAKKIEYVLQLPWDIEGNKFYFMAEDQDHALEILGSLLKEAQEVCEHKAWKRGKCVECELVCDHALYQDSNCLICGDYVALEARFDNEENGDS